MKHVVTTLLLLCLWPSLAMAKPIRVAWDLYQQGIVPAKRLVLYRGEEGDALMPYKVFQNMARTQFVDKDVTHDKTFCYELRAVTAEGVPSLPSDRVCKKPRK